MGDLRFKGERCLLPCNDFLLGLYLFYKSSYYFIQSFHYNQVLTWVLPYHGSNMEDTLAYIHAGKRPSRPVNSSQSQWLQDPIWNVITTGWHDRPEQRCKLSAMYHTFLPPTQQPRQQPKGILPRVASFFQFLQESESETQKHVNEMNEVSLSASPSRLIRKADTEG